MRSTCNHIRSNYTQFTKMQIWHFDFKKKRVNTHIVLKLSIKRMYSGQNSRRKDNVHVHVHVHSGKKLDAAKLVLFL